MLIPSDQFEKFKNYLQTGEGVSSKSEETNNKSDIEDNFEEKKGEEIKRTDFLIPPGKPDSEEEEKDGEVKKKAKRSQEKNKNL